MAQVAPLPAKSAVVFSCDEGYAFLAKGLVLSLGGLGYPTGDMQLVLVDIGIGPDTRAWMTDHGVTVVPIDDSLIPPAVMKVIKPVQRAQVIRPWLPNMLPQFDHLIWLDSDIWLQNGDLIGMMRGAANIAPHCVALATGNSHYSSEFYTGLWPLIGMQQRWYQAACEDPQEIHRFATSLNYSSGVFGMRRQCPIWQMWGQEVERVYPRIAERDPQVLHLAEQIALNIVVMRTNALVRLDPLLNFHCNSGGLMRLDNDRVVTNLVLPAREIGVMHLCNWSIIGAWYLKHNLLYRSGSYLTAAEREAALRLVIHQSAGLMPAA